MSKLTPINRPPVGFILEGHGEYGCYPSYMGKLIENFRHKVPRNNPQGCDNVIKNLEEELEDLIKTHHPHSVIISVDADDVVSRYKYSNCAEGKQDLFLRATSWIERMKLEGRLYPLPEYVSVVLQVKKFETWLAADPTALTFAGVARSEFRATEWPTELDLDSHLQDPYKWICEAIKDTASSKSPQDARKIAENSDVEKMQISRSFRKFSKEVRLAYGHWKRSYDEYIRSNS